MDRIRATPKPAAPRLLPGDGLSQHELAVLAAIRETPYGAVEVVMHQSRIVQIVRTEKLKVDEAPARE